jgi:E3 ubiquitin-protein ligase UBR1
MIAQIRTGLWVRNGFAIRGQLLHYRDFMLRELCYDQDIFILQTALIILDPNIVIVSILDRFGLLSYFCGAILNCAYEGVQLSSMVEEVLYLFITLLSENANASKMPLRVAVRREIVHALAMGPCSFTDLVKRVAERMVDDICFEPVLKEVANFKPPDSTSDTGVYELRDEAFDEVNPFFYHYTRNKREEVEIILQNRLKKKTGKPDPVIVPKPLGINTGPFSTLAAGFESEALLQVIFYALYNVLVLTDSTGTTPPSAEAILDQSLHLVMLALVERPSTFSQLAAVKAFEESKNVIDVLCTLEHHEKYKPYSARVEWILAQMKEYVPEEIQARRRVLETNRIKSPDPEDAKKRAAKTRQEAIMKQMKAQQASFAVNFDDEDEDEDMEETPEEHVSYGTCIVCQEDLNGTRPFGGLGLLQPSRLIRRHPDSHNMYLNEVLQTAPSMDRCTTPSYDSTFPPSDAHNRDMKAAASPNFEGFPAQYTRFGLHASACGHMMHLDCFQTYSMSIRQRHRSQATRNHPENISRKEFICPLCKSLGNVLIPVTHPVVTTLSSTPFPDWIRAAGIGILRSKPDPVLDSLQFRNGTGEFAFWSAQDPGYVSFLRLPGNEAMPDAEVARMVDTIMVVSKSLSQQTRHLRDRPEPEPGERGAGIYLPEELLGYTIAGLETAHRGTESQGGVIVDNLSDQQLQMVRGLLACLTKMAAMQLKGRADGGRDAIRQAIIKRLLPEWSRTSLTSFSYPLLLRDPFTVLVETAAVAPEMIRHVLILTYYACLARTVIGLVYVLNKTRSYSTVQIGRRNHEDIFGDVRMFFMSVVRHSPVFEHTATLVFETFGEARIEKLLYAFTLPFLRRAAILCRSVLPSAFPTPSFGGKEPCEYNRLLAMLGIPPLADLPNQDTLQNALSGWCAHYGHSHAASQLNCGVVLDYPAVYQIARLPIVLDNLFGGRDKAMKCSRCNTIPVDAAICLICGTTCCFQSHCCTDIEANQRGECNMHTRE